MTEIRPGLRGLEQPIDLLPIPYPENSRPARTMALDPVRANGDRRCTCSWTKRAISCT